MVTAEQKTTKPRKPAAGVPPAHPKYIDMIIAAITALKERTGSSRQAIVKYIVANYKVDPQKVPVRIRPALKKGVVSGKLKQVKGTGASGSFKVVKEETKPKPKPKRATKPKPKPKPKKKTTTPKKDEKKAKSKKKDEKAKAKKAASKKDTKKPKKSTGKKTPSKTGKKTVTKKPKVSPKKKPAAKKATKKSN